MWEGLSWVWVWIASITAWKIDGRGDGGEVGVLRCWIISSLLHADVQIYGCWTVEA